MTDPKIVVPFKAFVMQEGMTLEDVNNAPNLSAEAKKHIAIFDADGMELLAKEKLMCTMRHRFQQQFLVLC